VDVHVPRAAGELAGVEPALREREHARRGVVVEQAFDVRTHRLGVAGHVGVAVGVAVDGRGRDETVDVLGLDDIRPQQELTLVVTRTDGSKQELKVKSRIDTAIEVDYYKHGGILPYVLRELINSAGPASAKAA